MYCPKCGREIADNIRFCSFCGTSVTQSDHTNKSRKDWLITVLLSFFLGSLGAHRFYVGRTVSGIFQLITFGGLGIWALIDFIVILCGNFKDDQGLIISNRI